MTPTPASKELAERIKYLLGGCPHMDKKSCPCTDWIAVEIGAFAERAREEEGCPNCGCYLRIDKTKFHERMRELLLTCTMKGTSFDWNWYLDGLDEEMCYVQEESRKEALLEAAGVAEETPITDFGVLIEQTPLKIAIARRIRALAGKKEESHG